MPISPSELQGLKDVQATLIEKLNYLRKENAKLAPGASKFERIKDIEALEKELENLRLNILNATPSISNKKILDNLIYIAYHDSDEGIAEMVSIGLQKKGYSLWLRKSVTGGERERLERQKKLQNAKLVLIFLSEEGLRENGPLREDLELAKQLYVQGRDDEFFIIPIKLGNSTVPNVFSSLKKVEVRSDLELTPETIKKAVIQPILDEVATKFSLFDETGELTISNKFKQLSRTANRRYLDYFKGKSIEGISTNIMYLAGIYSYSIKQFDEAHLRFKKAKEFGYPEDRGIQSRIAGCLIKEGVKDKEEAKFKEALEILDKVLAKNPDYVLALYNKAIALKKLQREKEAKDTILFLLKQRPDSEMARNNLAIVLQEDGDLQGAIDTLSYLVERGKDAGLTNYNLACFYARTKKLKLAFERLLKSYEFDLENVIAAVDDPDLKLLKQTNDYGVSFWDITQDMHSYYIQKAINTGNVLIMADKLDEALEKLLEVNNLIPQNGQIHYTLARVYAQREEYDEALSSLKLAAQKSRQFVRRASHDPIFNQFKTREDGKIFWDFINSNKNPA